MTYFRVSVLLCAQRALLGAIGTGVRKIMCHWTEHEIQLRVIFDGPIPEEDAEAMSVAETEMMADFPNHQVSFKLERCDSPEKINRCDGEQSVFSRREP